MISIRESKRESCSIPVVSSVARMLTRAVAVLLGTDADHIHFVVRDDRGDVAQQADSIPRFYPH